MGEIRIPNAMYSNDRKKEQNTTQYILANETQNMDKFGMKVNYSKKYK